MTEKYIKASECEKYFYEHLDDYGMIGAMNAVDEMPAADVQPVKRGEWCPPLMGQGKCDTYCGRCFGKIMRNATGIFEETPFCPHCGADMRND